jgi:hypothetical protein
MVGVMDALAAGEAAVEDAAGKEPSHDVVAVFLVAGEESRTSG